MFVWEKTLNDKWENKASFIPLYMLEWSDWLKNILSFLTVKCPEAATGGVLLKKLFLEISQYSQENTCVGVSF